jgi:16S rRNA (adenine1518-N6/adenine1519-N6)-dimethyltransferase
VSPRRRFGQNFLVDLNIHDLIVSTAEVGPNDVVLEVGPGAGALTALMAERGATVVAIDVDPAMAALAAEAAADRPNVRVLLGDALQTKHKLNPEMLDAVRSALAAAPGRAFKLVANLPYNVAAPILSNLMVHPELRPERLVATVQKEMADRLAAAPATPDYGALSVVCQALAQATIVRVLPPSVFWPRPKVDSAVVAIVPDAARRAAVGDLDWFVSVVRGVFNLRRKALRGVLHALFKDREGWTKTEADRLLEELGLDGSLRAEALNVEEFRSLSDALARRFGGEAPPALEVNDDDRPSDDQPDAAVELHATPERGKP